MKKLTTKQILIIIFVIWIVVLAYLLINRNMAKREDGLYNFTSITFDSAYNKNHFVGGLPTKHSNNIFDDFSSGYYQLNIDQKTKTYLMVENIGLQNGQYKNLEPQNIIVNNNEFLVYTQEVLVGDTMEEMIVAVCYVSDYITQNATKIWLSQVEETANISYVNTINEMFEILMENYKENYSSKMVDYLDIIKLSNEEEEFRDLVALNQKQSRSVKVETESGFFINYDTQTLIPIENDYGKIRSFLINNGDTTKQSINFAVTTEPEVDVKMLLSLNSTLDTDILDSLDKEFEELEYETKTTIIEVDEKILTRRYFKFPTEIILKYYDVELDRQRDDISEANEIVVIYTYELDGKYYHMYNYSRIGFVTFNTYQECEFMFKNFSLE